MLIQISSGQGPLECQRVVWHVYQKLMTAFAQQGVVVEIVDKEDGGASKCFKSLSLSCKGDAADSLRQAWEGTIAWRGKSPFRPYHKRQNWFVKVSFCSQRDVDDFDLSQVKIESFRSASGPGGQHVNKSSTAIRVTYLPTGESVSCSAERSQLQNKQLALKRLRLEVEGLGETIRQEENSERRLEHYRLERGNAVQAFKGKL